MTAEENYRLLLEMDANRRFMLMAYRDNASLLARAEPRVRAWLSAATPSASAPDSQTPFSNPHCRHAS